MGFIDSLFGGKKMDDPVLLQQPWQTAGQEYLYNLSMPKTQSYLGKAGQAYPGDMTTPYEQTGLKQLGDYLQSPLASEGSLFGAAQGELQKTLGGGYDIGGTYYDAYRNAVMRELQQAKDRLMNERAAGDKLFGGGTTKESSELEEGAVGQLAMVLGQMFENERDRRLGAVGQAQNLLGFQQQEPLQRIAASQQYGALPFQRDYGEYIRQLESLGIPYQTALSLATHKPEYYQPGYEGGGLGSALGSLGMLGMGAEGLMGLGGSIVGGLGSAAGGLGSIAGLLAGI